MSSRPVIYALQDPRDGVTRYIGKANDIERRLRNHLKEARREKHHRARWICSLIAVGLEPRLVPLFSVVAGDWQSWEIHFIAEARAAGLPLTNATSGGDGVPDLSDECKARMIEKGALYLADPETKTKMSKASKLQWSNPLARGKMLAAMNSPDVKSKQRANIKAAKSTPQAREKQSAAMLKRFANPEELTKHSAAMSRPETRKKRSISMKERLANPENLAKLRATALRPDVRAKLRAASHRGHRLRSRGSLVGQMKLFD